MNNDAIRQFVRRELRAVTIGVATAIGIGGGLPAAIANPIGGSVVSGQGSITSPNATTTLINQQSNQLTLNWSSFNVAGNETVRFVQPSSTSVALNNILSQSPSQIFGHLDANGRVVLINPNGILFGRTAQLNVGSLIASSLELKAYDPATGRLSFQSLGGHPGAIDNEGSITAAPGGSVALLGGTVLNNGLVLADYGTVAMGAGNVATLDFFGGGLLRLQVSGDVKTNSSGAAAAVQNNGTIQANGGQVVLTAAATQDVFASAVDNSGIIRAARIKNVGGVIELLGTDGAASNSGTLDASGTDQTSTGGTVTVTGNSVALAGTTRVNVSGAAGGGSAFVGGGLHGADKSIQNASSTTVDSGASIDADATNAGNGGTIAVWSDGTTTAHGQLSANGGPAGGNGGMIETSGHVLDVTGGSVRAAAAVGKAGEWLLDPSDVQIDHATGAGTPLTGGNNANGTSPVSDADINATLAAGTNVTIQTSNSPPGSSTSIGKISFATGVSITNNGPSELSLTLDADTGIDMTGAATAPSITSGTKPLDLILNANVNGKATTSSLGSVALDGTINVNTLTITGTGQITQTAGSLITVAGATLLSDTGASGTSDITLSNASNTFAGDMTVSAANSNVAIANSAAGGTTLSGANTASSLTLDAGGAVNFGTVGTDSTTVTNGLIIQGVTGSGPAGGAVGEVGKLIVGTTTSVDAGTNNITLANAANALTGSVTLTGGAVTLANSTATTLAGADSAGSLTLDAGGAVTFGAVSTDSTTVTNGLIIQGVSGSGAAGGAVGQVGKLSVGTTSSINAGGNAITLGNSSNSFAGNVGFTGGAVTLGSGGALSSSGTASGNLSESAGGTISEGAGGIQLTGTAGANTATFTVTGAAHDVDLGSAANNFNDDATTITANAGGAVGNVRLADTNATFAPLTLPGTLTSLVLSDPNALITLGAETLTGVGAGTNLAGGTTALDVTGGSITQSGALVVTGTTAANTRGGAGDITLSNAANAFNGGITFGGNHVTVANTTGTTIAGASTAGSLTLDAGGAVTFGAVGTDRTTVTNGLIVQGLSGSGAAGGVVGQVGKLIVGTTTSIDAGTSNITLANAANTLTGSVTLTGGAVTLANSTATTLAGADSASSLTLDAGGAVTFGAVGTDSTTVTNGLIIQGVTGSGPAGGAVGEVGKLIVGTTTSIDAGTNNITLANAANALTGSVTLTGGAVTLANSTATTLAGANSASSLTLDAGGAVTFGAVGTDSTTVTSGLIIQGVSGSGAAGGAVGQVGKLSVGTTSSINAGGNAITLGNSSNSFGGNVAFTGAAVTLTSAGGLSSSGNASGNLSETAGGTISEGAAGIQLTAGNTATFTVTGGTHDVNLSNASNAFNGDATTIQASGGGTVGGVAVSDSSTAFVPLALPASLTSLVLHDSLASITLPSVTLTGVGGGTNVTGGTTTLDVTAGGPITQGGGTSLNVNGTTSFSAGTNAITVANSGNIFAGNVGFAGGAVTLASGGALSGSGTASGNLNETVGGTISEGAAGIQLTGTAGANTATFTVTGAAHDVDLGSAANNFNDDATTITANAGGAIGNVRVADNNATFAPLTLPGTLASLVLSDPNAPITLAALTLTGVGAGTNLAGGTTTLDVSSGGAITQTGALSVSGATTLSTNGGPGDITLSNAGNAFNGGVTLTGYHVTLANLVGTTLAGTNSANSNLTIDAGGAVTFGTATTDSTSVLGGLVIQGLSGAGAAGGAVTQVGTLTVDGTASINAGTNAITLSNFGDDFAAPVTVTGGAVTLANVGPMVIAGASSANSLTLDTVGIVTFGTASTDSTTVVNNLIVQGVTGSGPTSGPVTQVGTLSVGGTTNINANTSDITLGNAGNSFGGNVTFTGGAVALASAGALSSSGTASGNLSETAGGTISEGSAGIRLTGTAGTNTATFTATGAMHDVNLGNAANDFNREATTITASGGGAVGNVMVADTNATFVPLTLPGTLESLVLSDPNAPITLGAETLTGVGAGTNLAGGTTALDVTGGSITQSGALVVTGTTAVNTAGGAGDITLSNAANAFNGGITFGGNHVTVANTTGTTIAGASTAGSLTLDAGGAVTFGSASTDSTTVTNALIVQGLSGSGAAGGVVGQVGKLLVGTTTSIDAGTNNITLSNPANALAGTVTLTGGVVTLVNSDATTLGGTSSASSLTLDAGGAVNEVGTLSIATTTSINAGTNDITFGQANSFGGNVAFNGRNVTLATGTGDLMSSGTASGNLIETSAGAIIQGGSLSVTGRSALTASGGTGNITLANSGNAFAGPITLNGGAVTLANADATTLGGTDKAGSLTLDAGGAVTFGTTSTDSTTVTGALIVQGLSGSGAAGGAVSEVGTLSVGTTTSINAGTNDITLNQVNAFGSNVTFAGGNVALTAGAGGLTSSGTATGNLTQIAKGPASDLNIGTLSAGGNALLIAGSSILGTSSQATVTANNVEVRYGLENPNGQLGSANASQQVGFSAAPGSSRVQLTVWLPAPGTQFQNQNIRQTQSDVLITRHPFVAGEQAILYSAPFGVTPGQVAGTLNAIQTTLQGTATQSAGVAQGAATQGTQSVLYIDWGSYNPNVSLFGTLNPAVCLPADQRDEGVGSGSGCAAASASVVRTPTPILVAMVPTREGLKPMPLFYLAQ